MVLFLEEKLVILKLNYVVLGLYFYDNDVIEIVRGLKKLVCGEYEIIEVNQVYFNQGRLVVEVLVCGIVWLDIGIFDLLLDVVDFVWILECWQGLKVSIFEEVVWCMGWIDDEQLVQ